MSIHDITKAEFETVMLSARRHLDGLAVKFASNRIRDRRAVSDLSELRKQAELKYADKLQERIRRQVSKFNPTQILSLLIVK